MSGRVITHRQRRNVIDAIGMAADLGTPMTVHLIQHPPEMTGMAPLDRLVYWHSMRQTLAEIAKSLGFPFRYVRIRETDPNTHDHEHAHYLIAIPADLIDRFTAAVERKAENTMVVRIRDANVASYVLKAADRRSLASDDEAWFRRSGAVLGPRVTVCRALDEKARANGYALQPALAARRDERLERERMAKRVRREKRYVAALMSSARRPMCQPIEPVRSSTLSRGMDVG